MKRNLLAASLIMLSLTAGAQVTLRTADVIRIAEIENAAHGQQSPMSASVAGQSAAGTVDLIVRYSSPQALDLIEARGGEILNLVGRRTAIVRVSPSAAQSVAASTGVTGAMLSRKMRRVNDKALPASHIPEIHQGTGLTGSYDGKGVVVGLFDTGIDPNHINFTDADGNTRIKAIYSYSSPSAVPEVLDTPAKISTYDCDTRNESHGTHVLGVIAGSFVDTSDSSAPDYRGVAPGADIIVTAGEGYNAQILDGVERVCRYARDNGKRAVVNLSFGDNVGPHDGSDEFTEAINDIADKYDAVICLAGGNERDKKIAIVKTLTEEKNTVSTLLVKGDTEVGGNFQTYGPIEIWTSDNTPFEVTLDIVSRSTPNSPVYTLEVPEKKETYVVAGETIDQYLQNTSRMTLIKEGTQFHTMYTNSFMGGVRGVDSYNHRYRALLNAYIEGRTSSTVSRYFVKVTVKGQPGQKIFMYCDGTYMNFGNRNIPGLDVPDGYGTNSNMACGKSTIAVGSYVTANRPTSLYPTGTIGAPSYFSSYGETLDGRVMPHICAPGQVIVSSRNSYTPTSSNYALVYPLEYSYTDRNSRKTYYWTSCAGTSQAAPHMAGIAALWLQTDPTLTLTDIQDIAASTADMPESGQGWGHGKVNALAGIREILRRSSLSNIVSDTQESILIEETAAGYLVSAPGQESVSVTMTDMSGRVVASATADGDTAEISTAGMPQGVYILTARCPRSTRSVKTLVR